MKWNKIRSVIYGDLEARQDASVLLKQLKLQINLNQPIHLVNEYPIWSKGNDIIITTGMNDCFFFIHFILFRFMSWGTDTCR